MAATHYLRGSFLLRSFAWNKGIWWDFFSTAYMGCL
jgi:hypothetical protein